MPLEIQLNEEARGTVMRLIGQLDTDTAHGMEPVIEQLRREPPSVLILALQDLNYISSAGLRCIFQMKKIMQAVPGRMVISEPSPQVRKVLEIIRAVPDRSIFSSVRELDDYLDRMQKQVTSGQDS